MTIYIYIPHNDPERWGRMRSSNWTLSLTNLDRPRIYIAVADAALQDFKAMRIHRTKMGCPSRQRRKSQSEINKSIEGNQSQENYHSTQDYFVSQPNASRVKGNAIRINWPKANDDRWKVLGEKVSFILRNSLRGSFGMKLHSFTKTIHAVCLEHFGDEDVQKGKKHTNSQ